ncbi:MAG: beta propeller repeat protein [Acidimicrobiales bacterium]
MGPGEYARSWAAPAIGVALAGVLLAACATTAAVRPSVAGVPTRSISIALSVVGCTRNDVCVAVGSSTTAVGLAATGEFSTPHSPWIPLYLPPVGAPSIEAIGCGGTSCLVGGSQPGGDLLWSYSATTHQVSVVTAPSGGAGVEAIGCNARVCALADAGATSGRPRWSTSVDGGATWSAPVPLPLAAGDVVTSIACSSATRCVLAGRTAERGVLAASTTDAGATWTPLAVPGRWVALTSLTCVATQCRGLARTPSASLLVRLSVGDGRWRTSPLPGPARAMACAPGGACVVVGGAGGRPFIETRVAGRAAVEPRVRYVPGDLVGVACGTRRCAAIGDTTLVDVPSSLVAP